jgi:hypothetical protein
MNRLVSLVFQINMGRGTSSGGSDTSINDSIMEETACIACKKQMDNSNSHGLPNTSRVVICPRRYK